MTDHRFILLPFIKTAICWLGHQINIGCFVIVSLAILFFFIGLMTPKIKKNYTIGIRLPWTMHSEIVWDKTHRFGGRLFIALAILMAVISFLPGLYAFWILIGAMILFLAILIWYSYREWRIIERGRKF